MRIPLFKVKWAVCKRFAIVLRDVDNEYLFVTPQCSLSSVRCIWRDVQSCVILAYVSGNTEGSSDTES